MKLPLGEREGQLLELKSARVLDERDKPGRLAPLAREVVAMLNADHDSAAIWVGIGERDGIAAAHEPVANAEDAKRRLVDYFVETIEPSPRSREVDIEVIGDVLRIVVNGHRAKERRPFAHVSESRRLFVVRVADRVRPMTREEVREAFREAERDPGEELAASVMRDLQATKETGLHVHVRTTAKVELPIAKKGDLDPYYRDPLLTGNRPSGWTFVNPYGAIELKAGKVVWGTNNEAFTRTVVHQDGGIMFHAPLSRLYWKGPPDELWPYTLIEYPASIVRLARALYLEKATPLPDDDDFVVIALGLFGIAGQKVADPTYRARQVRPFDGTTLLLQPAIGGFRDLRERPDELALRLAHKLYEGFGRYSDEVPATLGPDGKLVIHIA